MILKQQQLLNWLGAAGTLPVLVALPAQAQVEPITPMPLYSTEAKWGSVGIEKLRDTLFSPKIQPEASAKLPYPKELDSLFAEAKFLAQESSPAEPRFSKIESVAQAASVIPVTGVRLNRTDRGLEVILETPGDREPRVFKTRYGNTLAIDIPNTQLRLPEAREFRRENPTPRLASVRVVQQNSNTTRVIVTGTEVVPAAEVVPSPEGVAFSVTTPTAAAQEAPEPEAPAEEPPAPTTPERPEPEPSAPAEPTAEGEEPIELIVTPTRTEEESEDVPRSVTVITQQQIEEQASLITNLGDILGQTVPGLAPSNQSLSEFGQTLRGRQPLVVIDGVPQSTSRDSSRNLRTIDPRTIERIEILRGPTAIYGNGATGGVINIITKPGGEGRPSFTAEAGVTGSLSHLEDSLGGMGKLAVSGKENNIDYRFSGLFEKIGGFFDAEGDRIPPDLLSTQGSLADTNTVNLFGKVGWESDSHRLQLTVNYFDTDQVTDYTTDPAVNEFDPGTQKALAREGLELEDQSEIRNTLVNLEYSHPDLLFGSQVEAQVYYRDYLTRFFPFDGRRFDLTTEDGLSIFQSRVESQEFGGRVEINTPLSEENGLTLLSGLDYSNEDAVQPVAIFDTETFEASDGLVFEQIDDRPWVPPLNQEKLGLFSQLRWQPIERLIVRGGLRYQSIGVDVDSFTTLDGNEVGGGNLDYDATLFNLGAVYDLSNELDVFASFSQGFSVADVGLVLRGASAGFSVESLRPEPQKVNSYEIGIRGSWNAIQASLTGFYNQSSLGTTFDRETLEIVRAPERVYGLELAVDAELSQRWRLGSTVSYVEGENDVDEDGDYLPLNGFRISPPKVTAYIENETLPSWQNRLQLLYSGSRDRAFEEGVDPREVDSYLTLDYISSIKIGNGTLRLGIQNLLNNQYFTSASQLLRLGTNDTYTAAPGRTFSLQYFAEF